MKVLDHMLKILSGNFPHLKEGTQEQDSFQYLVERISLAVQRGNAASVLGCLGGLIGGRG